MLYVFAACGVGVGIVLLVIYLISGELGAMNIHLAAYGYILMGLGFVMSLLTKREKGGEDLLAHIQYVMDKKNKDVLEEIKGIRGLIWDLEIRKGKRSAAAEEGEPEDAEPR